MRNSIRTFRNVRVRLLREADGAWHAGWIEHLSPDMARIRLQAFALLRRNERFVCECYGDGTLVRFQGMLAGQAGQDVALAIVGAMSYEPSRESVRVLVEGVAGRAWDESREANLIVLDASPEGLGGIADAPFSPGTMLEVALEIEDRTYEATVRVSNCRAEETQSGYSRLGMLILQSSRLSTAVWRRMLDERTS